MSAPISQPDEMESKRRLGLHVQRRGDGFTEAESMEMLQLVRNHWREGWDVIAQLHNQQFSKHNRSADSLKKKFSRLYRCNVPARGAKNHQAISFAHLVHKEMVEGIVPSPGAAVPSVDDKQSEDSVQAAPGDERAHDGGATESEHSWVDTATEAPAGTAATGAGTTSTAGSTAMPSSVAAATRPRVRPPRPTSGWYNSAAVLPPEATPLPSDDLLTSVLKVILRSQYQRDLDREEERIHREEEQRRRREETEQRRQEEEDRRNEEREERRRRNEERAEEREENRRRHEQFMQMMMLLLGKNDADQQRVTESYGGFALSPLHRALNCHAWYFHSVLVKMLAPFWFQLGTRANPPTTRGYCYQKPAHRFSVFISTPCNTFASKFPTATRLPLNSSHFSVAGQLQAALPASSLTAQTVHSYVDPRHVPAHIVDAARAFLPAKVVSPVDAPLVLALAPNPVDVALPIRLTRPFGLNHDSKLNRYSQSATEVYVIVLQQLAIDYSDSATHLLSVVALEPLAAHSDSASVGARAHYQSLQSLTTAEVVSLSIFMDFRDTYFSLSLRDKILTQIAGGRKASSLATHFFTHFLGEHCSPSVFFFRCRIDLCPVKLSKLALERASCAFMPRKLGVVHLSDHVPSLLPFLPHFFK
ncbi:hypothetical protein PsorP6_003647 [Peronosclerospora sorghi]|uniref:Uncharacterized protein n=1 Tax=Peronosclerospora sorghi TaxID=230839 RepID=A0ACC0VM79_9STRA|nr:hypothetical protein PsorP6_003647 [Peronosclerospora sorghi]